MATGGGFTAIVGNSDCGGGGELLELERVESCGMNRASTGIDCREVHSSTGHWDAKRHSS
jgi:hypothetical protein